MRGRGRLFLGSEEVIWGLVSERLSGEAEEIGRVYFLVQCLGMVRSPSLKGDD